MRRSLVGRFRPVLVVTALALLAETLLGSIGSTAVGASSVMPTGTVSQANLTKLIEASLKLNKLPNATTPSITTLLNNGDFGSPLGTTTCGYIGTSSYQENITHCYFGDTKSTVTVALIGDSRASMYLQAFDSLGKLEHFRVLFIAKDGCPTPLATYMTNNGGRVSHSPWVACTRFHSYVISSLNRLKPRAIVISSNSQLDLANPVHEAAGPEVQADMTAFLAKLPKSSRVIVLGGFPQPAPVANPTVCLSRHPNDVKACAFTPSADILSYNAAFASAAKAEGDVFVNQTPWYCASSCPALVGKYIPYTIDAYHADNTYLQFLLGVLWSAIGKYVG